MRKMFSLYVKNDDGVAAIETAFIMPLLLIMFTGMIDLTNLINSNRKLTQATAVISDVITRSKNQIEVSSIVDTIKVVDMIMKEGDAPTEASIRVRGFRKNGTTTSQIWQVTQGNCTTGFVTADLDPLIVQDTSKNPPEYNDIIVAEICKPFTPWAGNILGDKILGATTFNVSEVIKVRSRVSNKLTCFKTSSYIPGNECNETL
jgi:Flp pilus assembly protein TadG